MKAIMVLFDSLNRHMLPPYGCNWVHAPNFKRLAERTVTFEKSYVASMPCMPTRRELHTGRYNFLHRGWGPIEPFDDSMPEILKNNGIYTHLATDHQHYFEDGGATYHTRYSSWEFARGQEGDPWKGQLKDPEIPESVENYITQTNLWRQDWINRSYMTKEEDQSQSRTFQMGFDFIRNNHAEDNWLLQIESFDPHEPFFTQQKYKDLYPDDYDGPHFDWPFYTPVTETDDEVRHIRNQYAALVSMCDAHLGKLLDMMDELNLWEDTMLIVLTDHGFLLGEHNWWAKMVQPIYEEISHTPLFIWDPRSKRQNERCDCLVQTTDIAPTLLEFFGMEMPKDMQGKVLKDTIASNKSVREAALFGLFGAHVNCTDGRYMYMRAPATPENEPLYNYTLMPTHMRSLFGTEELQHIEVADPFSFTKGCQVMKLKANPRRVDYHKFGTLLFDLENDPKQEQPLNDPNIEKYMIDHMVRLMCENESPEEQFERLGLPLAR